jgi:endoglucanase
MNLNKNLFNVVVLFFFLLITTSLGFAQERLRGFNVTKDLSAQDLAVLNDWNVNVVRFQLAFGDTDNMSLDTYRQELNKALANLDSLLPLFRLYNIKIVLDLHTPPGGFATRNLPPKFRVFTDTAYATALLNIWPEIALKYKDNDLFYAFDILSEPATGVRGISQEWVEYAAALTTVIVNIDPDRKVIVAPDYALPQNLGKFGRRFARAIGRDTYRNNIVHNIHLFTPFRYVTQGANSPQIKPIIFPSRQANKKVIATALKRLRRAQSRLRVPIFIGEFSVARWAPNAERYLNVFLRQLEKNKLDWAYHIFREANVWSLEHTEDINNPNVSSTETGRARIVKSFLARNG